MDEDKWVRHYEHKFLLLSEKKALLEAEIQFWKQRPTSQ